MIKRLTSGLFVIVSLTATAAAEPLLVLHMDFNSVQMRKECVIDCLRTAAAAGYNAVLWEVENKIRWETCPECVHHDAFTKEEFRSILDEADRLGLRPIPLMQTFGHAEYVLLHERRRGLLEDPSFPSCYCVSRPETRSFLKAFLHEYLEVFGDRVKDFHLGGDEAVVFGSCPICRKRDKMELYAEHLLAVSEELRVRGVRPGVWCDMILKAGEAGTAKIPRDFTIWHWDYAYGLPGKNEASWTGKTDLLQRLGFEVIFAASTSSCGDGPFLPRYRHHGVNVAAAAALARKEKFRGLCVTSWSVHPIPKALQYPLWEFAAKRYLAPGADEERDFSDCLVRQFGPVSPDCLRTLTEWDSEFPAFDGRFWQPPMKCCIPAPPGHLKMVMDGKLKDGPAAITNLVLAVDRRASVLKAALAEVRKVSDGGTSAKLLAEGAELSISYLDELRSALSRQDFNDRVVGRSEVYFATWMQPYAAKEVARSIWSVLSR